MSMGFFSRKDDKSPPVVAAPAADEFVITDQDIARCATLLAAFDAANRDLSAPDDFKVRVAIRAIAEAGSGIPLTSWAPLTQSGDQASDRAWRWLAACSRAASERDDNVVPVTVAMFANAWDEVAPGPTAADPVELGLLQPPDALLAEMVAGSVISAASVPTDHLVWHVAGEPITAGVAQRGHARVLLELDGRDRPVDDKAKAIAVGLLS